MEIFSWRCIILLAKRFWYQCRQLLFSNYLQEHWNYRYQYFTILDWSIRCCQNRRNHHLLAVPDRSVGAQEAIDDRINWWSFVHVLRRWLHCNCKTCGSSNELPTTFWCICRFLFLLVDCKFTAHQTPNDITNHSVGILHPNLEPNTLGNKRRDLRSKCPNVSSSTCRCP